MNLSTVLSVASEVEAENESISAPLPSIAFVAGGLLVDEKQASECSRHLKPLNSLKPAPPAVGLDDFEGEQLSEEPDDSQRLDDEI